MSRVKMNDKKTIAVKEQSGPTKFMRMVDGQSGRWMVFNQDQFITPTLSLFGTYSSDETELCRQYLSPGDTVIVVGANIGAVAIQLAQRVWPAMLTCFEPQRLMSQALGGNALLHGCDNIRIEECAVGAENGTARITPSDPRSPANTGGVEVNSKGSDEVRMVTLDAFFSNQSKLRFLHIDAEGLEPEVLIGAKSIIQAHKPIIVAEIDRPNARAKTIMLLQDYGYTRLYEHKPPLIGNFVSINILALPDGEPEPIQDGHLHKM